MKIGHPFLDGAYKVLLLFLVLCAPAGAQTFEFLPEVDTYVKLNSSLRFVFQAKETREAGDPTQAEVGPSLEFYLRPLLRLKAVTAFDLDQSKSRPLVLSVGYRYVPSPDKPPIERMELVATSHLPLVAGLLISDRNREDLDWSDNEFHWRYRNRVTLERAVKIGSYHPAPYVSAEFFYLSQYQKWSTTALYAGSLFPVGKHVQFNPYYEHQNNTGQHPNQQLEQFGLILTLHF
jgi:hypothetical protein